MRRLFLFLALCLLPAFAAKAACQGQNLIEALPPDQRLTLEQAAAAAPFAQGNLWRARRDGFVITLVGTYHLDDPRHDPTFARLAPILAQAQGLLVEAGPAEAARLADEIAHNPLRIFDFPGKRLDEVLGPDTWQRLSDALLARNMPPPLALKMRPWYLTTILAIAPCQMTDIAQGNGLDRRLIQAASSQGKPIQALEPWDTLFSLFDTVPPAEQLSFLMQTVDAAPDSDAMAVTLADSYFTGQNRLFWEFSKFDALRRSDLPDDEVLRALDQMEQVLITNRNQSWINPIETAAGKGPIVVAVGALHLPGKNGVLNLLAKRGWSITRLAP